MQGKKGANFLAIAKNESVNLFSENSDLKGAVSLRHDLGNRS